ncbi:MAG TPA: hypothetical protein VGM05_22905, partial [Planctomycetaceae bacterium]
QGLSPRYPGEDMLRSLRSTGACLFLFAGMLAGLVSTPPKTRQSAIADFQFSICNFTSAPLRPK